MKYLRLLKDENDFGFILDGINTILDTDILISNEDYNYFFDQQAQGKQFRLKSNLPERGSLFDFVEEYVPEVTPEKDRFFSVSRNTDGLIKSGHNIVFNCKNQMGGGTILVTLIPMMDVYVTS